MIYAVIGMLQPILTKTKETSDSISKVHAKLYFIFYNTTKNHKTSSAIYLTIVFRKVIFIYINQFTLNLSNFSRVFMLQPRRNTFRHSPYDKIIVISFQQSIMKDFFYLLFLMDILIISK